MNKKEICPKCKREVDFLTYKKICIDCHNEKLNNMLKSDG